MTDPQETRSTIAVTSDWQEENREAIASANAWIEAHGLPLAKHRLF